MSPWQSQRPRVARRPGFTLVELLVVVLIIGILAAIALPRFLGQRTKAKNAAAQAAVRHALLAARSYYTQNGESYAGLGPAELKGYESSLSGTEAADGQQPGASGVNPQDIWIGNGVDANNPTSGDANAGKTVTLCSVSRGDTTYCIRDASGVVSYLALQAAAVSAGSDGTLYTSNGWASPVANPSSSVSYGDTFDSAGAGLKLSARSPTGANAHGSWVWNYSGIGQTDSTINLVVTSAGRARLASTVGPVTSEYEHNDTWTDGSVSVDWIGVGTGGGYVMLRARTPAGVQAGGATMKGYTTYLDQLTGTLYLNYTLGGGSFVTLGSVASGFATPVTGTHNLKLECIGTAIKVYLDGTVKISVTDANVTQAGVSRLQIHKADAGAASDTNGVHADNFLVTKQA